MVQSDWFVLTGYGRVDSHNNTMDKFVDLLALLLSKASQQRFILDKC